ncbi:unnamed protein product [Vitrella brassicaformis CCMP3155]|uniref:Uncharacterized protein n=1 Tax=Vitrella brassicaformis (strain CCMP3155) TaxID=1169540 RepID=A0A0G4F4C1_VITBC|nr:unnamed protein product [Vitrella brassicaformis CCMP3155]|mmetsp:Transcript_28135/g.70234  ORF Transcript_28135/g.70234 Transcript_28135/m.70234 type:complete len:134 (+) Transcript_28135:148-549(+)|eukprot:CEM06723.1 unnamed protein product [Vitrella brassicaformis CCMP3155]
MTLDWGNVRGVGSWSRSFWNLLKVRKERFLQKDLYRSLYKYSRKRAKRFDKRTGLLSAGVPSLVMLFVATAAGVVVIDRQFEIRDLRVRSIGQRELSLQEEHDRMVKFLNESEKEIKTGEALQFKQLPKEAKV